MYSKVLLAVDVSEVSKLLVGQLPNLIKVGLREVVTSGKIPTVDELKEIISNCHA